MLTELFSFNLLPSRIWVEYSTKSEHSMRPWRIGRNVDQTRRSFCHRRFVLQIPLVGRLWVAARPVRTATTHVRNSQGEEQSAGHLLHRACIHLPERERGG